ncbi:hypothetical protein HYS91_01860 [Candidatus Daviesbacteria bacterium]|nr:hypothetical protein [Candidatus Daviesbacteria bacterium]
MISELGQRVSRARETFEDIALEARSRAQVSGVDVGVLMPFTCDAINIFSEPGEEVYGRERLHPLITALQFGTYGFVIDTIRASIIFGRAFLEVARDRARGISDPQKPLSFVFYPRI